jgi:hypothetical protein
MNIFFQICDFESAETQTYCLWDPGSCINCQTKWWKITWREISNGQHVNGYIATEWCWNCTDQKRLKFPSTISMSIVCWNIHLHLDVETLHQNLQNKRQATNHEMTMGTCLMNQCNNQSHLAPYKQSSAVLQSTSLTAPRPINKSPSRMKCSCSQWSCSQQREICLIIIHD